MCKIVDYMVAAFLVIAGYKDWRTKRISISILCIVTILAIIARLFITQASVWSTMGGILIGIFFFVVSKCSKEAVGYGDSWLITSLGVYMGGMKLLEVMLIASFLTSLYSILYCVRRGWSRNYTIPFVPFIAVAYIGVLLI